MWLYVLICVIILLIAIIFGLFVIAKGRFQVAIIKINEAEENVGLLLKEKYDLLLEISKFVKEKTNEATFDGLENININEINNFDLNSELSKYDNSILELSEFNKDIEFSEEELKIFDDLGNINIQSLAVMRYYNDNVTLYNELINKFPSSIVAKLKGYKEKKLYSNEKEEIFEILKK